MAPKAYQRTRNRMFTTNQWDRNFGDPEIIQMCTFVCKKMTKFGRKNLFNITSTKIIKDVITKTCNDY